MSQDGPLNRPSRPSGCDEGIAAKRQECAYCEGVEATHRVRWTIYGGGLKSKLVCDRHAERAYGQRGIEIVPLREPVVVIANADQTIVDVPHV